MLTGDLGFNALEHLKNVLGERFLNAGIAEQNMISLAAGLAKMGLRPISHRLFMPARLNKFAMIFVFKICQSA